MKNLFKEITTLGEQPHGKYTIEETVTIAYTYKTFAILYSMKP